MQTYDWITPAEAAYWFTYDPDTGKLFWKRKRVRNTVGQEIRSKTVNLESNGVRRSMKKTRVIWALVTGEIPPDVVDHKDGNDSNNKWDNLRAATHQQNQFNKKATGKYAKGVVFKADARRSKPWSARIRINGKKVVLGSYATHDEAARAYSEAAKKLHGEFYTNRR